MTESKPLKPSTLAAQALGWIDETTHAVVAPIHTSTTYIRDPDNQYRTGRSYSRDDNPSYDQAEALLKTLEGGRDCLLFASGMAAATAVFQALKPGDHVIAQSVMYWGLRKWLGEFATEWGLEVAFTPPGDASALKAALGPAARASCGSRRLPIRPGRSRTSPSGRHSRMRPERSSRWTARWRRRC